jgi:hypothetical protein
MEKLEIIFEKKCMIKPCDNTQLNNFFNSYACIKCNKECIIDFNNSYQNYKNIYWCNRCKNNTAHSPI